MNVYELRDEMILRRGIDYIIQEGEIYLSMTDVVSTINKYKKDLIPAIPSFIAEHIERSKSRKLSLIDALNEASSFDNIRIWLMGHANQDRFAKAWTVGYVIESEPEYEVVSDTSPHVVAIGILLMPLYHTYPELHKINVGRQIIEIYMFNNNEDSELCFVIAGTEDSDRYDCNLFLDSDLCSSPSNFDSYDDILSDIAHMIYEVDDSYNKHNIDIETFIKYSDTAQNPLWKTN